MAQQDRTYLFEKAPIGKALASFAVPTIISQLVSMIYNLADMYWIGKTNNPYMVVATTLSYVLFMVVNALAQLFGIGGGALTSRLLGEYKEDDARTIGSFSFYSALIVGVIYSLGVFIFLDPLLKFLGASVDTYEYSRQYAIWVVVVGCVPTILGIALSHLLRAEGYTKEAGIGLSMGGILNIILDPIFMFYVMEPGYEVKGAAVATMISNCCAFIYYMSVYFKHRKDLLMTLKPAVFLKGAKFWKGVLSVGFPSFIAPFLASITVSTANRLCSAHSDVIVASFGIAKKIDMLPMNVSLGLVQGMVPLVAYNYSNKNYDRMRGFVNTTRTAGICFAILCIIVFESIPGSIVGIFIKESETLAAATLSLRLMCISTPFMISIFHICYTYQAMGQGLKSLLVTCCRQGLVNIPLLIIMNKIWGVTGIYLSQMVCDIIIASIAYPRYFKFQRKLDAELELEQKGKGTND